MGVLRPATPGFLITTLATALLLVVSFSVPWFKSVYFLKAQVTESGQSGFITFGVLGYCTTINGGNTNCTSAKIGYEFNPNALLGDNVKFLQIPSVVVKWITWALVLHIIAFGLAAIAAIFGLLAHIREFSMTCFSSCISGIAAAVAFIAFIIDLVLFFTVKSRINQVKGGSAVIGNAVWLTLASWLLLFFSGCFYTIGRCCITRRPRGSNGDKWRGPDDSGSNSKNNDYAELMRLDAVKAEADRKARQATGERGLPAFPTLEERKPLSSSYEAAYAEDNEPSSPYYDNATGVGRVAGPRSPRLQTTDMSNQNVTSSARTNTGYTPGNLGTRTVDQYNNAAQSTYMPQTPSRVSQRQASPNQGLQYDPVAYQNNNSYYNSQPQTEQYPAQAHYSDPSVTSNQNPYGAIANAAGFAAAGAYATQASYYNQPAHAQQPTAGNYAYGHGQDQTTYHSTYTHPQEYSHYNQGSYANPEPYMGMPNPHDSNDPRPHTYGSNLNPNDQNDARPKSTGTSYFPYNNTQEKSDYDNYVHHGTSLHPVEEASGSTSDHLPNYSNISHTYGGNWHNQKS